MRDDKARKPRRYTRAAIAGGVAAIVLAGIAAGTVPSNILQNVPPNPHVALKPWIALGTLLAILGAGMGIAGSARRIAFRATAAGAVALALLAWTTPLVPAPDPNDVDALWRTAEDVWMLAAVVAVFSISSFAGALAGGKPSEDGRGPMQFSMCELLLVFLPFAVFMGYVGHFVRK